MSSKTHSKLLQNFNTYLRRQKLSSKTVRNYRSDVRQFLSWIKQEIRSSITVKHFQNYKSHLQSQKIPRSTLTRRLASLRKFAQFLNLDLNLSNPSPPLIPTTLKNFKAHLVKKRYKSKTIANYISDVKHYLHWATQQ